MTCRVGITTAPNKGTCLLHFKGLGRYPLPDSWTTLKRYNSREEAQAFAEDFAKECECEVGTTESEPKPGPSQKLGMGWYVYHLEFND